jgi:hypothetical protein
MKFSYHRYCVGKPEKKFSDGKLTYWVGNRKINLGYDWITAELEFEEIFELLSVGGYAFAPALNTEHRIQENFVSHELALVDIDSGMTIAELKQHPFYQLYGSGYYTTPSHTDTEPRFRILYRLPVAITEAETMRVIYEGLLAVHGSADISCKDAVRLFYGTVDAKHREITDRSIDAQGLELLIQARDIVIEQQQRNAPSIKHDDREYEPKTVEQVAELLDELRKYYVDLSYHLRRDVTWAVASAVSNIETVQLMRSRWNDSDKTMKYETFVNDRKKTALTLGTIYHIIRQHNPSFAKPLRELSLTELKLLARK